MRRLVTIAVDESTGDMVALTGASNVEVARFRPHDERHDTQVIVARELVTAGFEALLAEGYPRAGLCVRSES